MEVSAKKFGSFLSSVAIAAREVYAHGGVPVQLIQAQQLRLHSRLERVFERSFVEPETRAADDHIFGTEIFPRFFQGGGDVCMCRPG
jgi:hypothetical protein